MRKGEGEVLCSNTCSCRGGWVHERRGTLWPGCTKGEQGWKSGGGSGGELGVFMCVCLFGKDGRQIDWKVHRK